MLVLACSSLQAIPSSTETLELAAGDVSVRASAIDANGQFLYLATGGVGSGAPVRLVRIDLASFGRAGAIEFDASVESVASITLPPPGDTAYLSVDSEPNRLVRVDLASFEVLDELELGAGQPVFGSAVSNADGSKLFYVAQRDPGQVQRLDTATFALDGVIDLPDAPSRRLVDSIAGSQGHYGYFTMSNWSFLQWSGTFVVRVDLDAFAVVDSLELSSGRLRKPLLVDGGAGRLWLGGNDAATQSYSSATINEVDLDTMTESGAVTLPEGELWVDAVAAHPDRGVFGFAGGNGPSRMVYFNRDRMAIVGSYPFADETLGELVTARTDPDGEHAYFMSDNEPVRVVRLPLAQAQLLVSRAGIEFVDAEVGQAARPVTVTIENPGTAPAESLSLTLDGADFGIVSHDCPETLAVDAACTAELYFAPGAVGPSQSVLSVGANDTATREVSLRGVGQPAGQSMLRREHSEHGPFDWDARPGYVGRAFDGAGFQAGALTWTGGEPLIDGQPDPDWGVFEYSRRFDPQFGGGSLVPASFGMRARDGVNSSDFYQAFLGIVEPTGALVRIDRGSPPDRDVLTLPQSDGPVTSVAIDPSDEFVLFTTAGDSGYLAEVSNQPFELTRSTEISATAGIGAMLVDDAFETAWLAVNSTPPKILEVALSDFSIGAELELTGVDPSVDMGRRVAGASTAYFATSAEPGRIIRVDLETMSVTGEMTLDAAAGSALDLEVASNGETLYLSGNGDGFGVVTEVDFPSRSITGRYYMGPFDGSAGGPLLDESEQLLYVPVTGGAFRLVHFDLAGPELRFEPESLQFYEDPDLPGSGPPKTAAVELVNEGDSAASALGLFLSDERFGFESGCGETIEPGASCTITVQYDPYTPGPAQAALHAHTGENASGSLTLLVGEDVRYFRDRFEAEQIEP
jgi:hypothetical protein